MTDIRATKATFKRVGDDYQVVFYQPHGSLVPQDKLSLALSNLDLGSEEKKRIFQLAEGEEVSVPLSLAVSPARWELELKPQSTEALG